MSHPRPSPPSPIADALRRRLGSPLQGVRALVWVGGDGVRGDPRQPLFVEFQFDGSPPLRGAGSSDGASIGLSEPGPLTRIELDHGAALEPVDATAAAGFRDVLGRRLDAAIVHEVRSTGACVAVELVVEGGASVAFWTDGYDELHLARVAPLEELEELEPIRSTRLDGRR